MSVYDSLTGRYAFACPTRGETSVRLSAFRTLTRLPGATHPAVYRVRFACSCETRLTDTDEQAGHRTATPTEPRAPPGASSRNDDG